jgi:uncharacterized membrane protein
LKAIDVATLALNAALYAALGYVFFAVLPLTTPGLGTVRFWPQVVIPAVFAAIFGPWVGGLGAGIGIFINDMLIHGNALLSLTAGVTSNIAMFAIVGFFSQKRIDWRLPAIAFGIVTAVIAWLSLKILSPSESGLQLQYLAAGIVVAFYAFYLVVVLIAPNWRSYSTGCMLGLLVGSAIIGITVPLVMQLPLVPTSLLYFIWTFVTEIPFLLALGPPIIKAVRRALPPSAQKNSEEGDQK